MAVSLYSNIYNKTANDILLLRIFAVFDCIHIHSKLINSNPVTPRRKQLKHEEIYRQYEPARRQVPLYDK